MFTKAIRLFSLAALMVVLASIPGCTARSITITSNPPGAEVTINHRLVGVTPCRVGFTHYGVYRIELRKEKYEVVVKEENINPPIYGYEPLTIVSDNAIPARLNDDIYLHYVMKKEGDVSERSALLQRAGMARSGQIQRKDGSTVSVPYSVPEKTPEQIAKDNQKKAEAAGTPDKTTTTTPPVADPNFKIKTIQTEEPKPPTIGKELNIQPKTPVPDKKPETPKSPDPKKDQPPARTPKSEELIFEKPKDDKSDGQKTEDPKTEAPKTTLPK